MFGVAQGKKEVNWKDKLDYNRPHQNAYQLHTENG